MNCSRSLTLVIALAVVCLVPQSASAAYGDLDASFGSWGKVRLPAALSRKPQAIRVQADGKILVSTSGGLFRLTRSGAVDKSFTAGGAYGSPDELELLADGRIALIDDGRTLTVLRPNGKPDPNFADSGELTLGTGSTGLQGRSIAIQGGTKILVSGSIDGSTTTTSVMRVNSDGSVDQTFGNGGTATVASNYGGSYSFRRPANGSAIAVTKAGEILLGIDYVAEFQAPNAAVVKFSRDGERIMNFGIGGVAPVLIDGGIRDGLVDIAIAENGNFIAVGEGAFPGRGLGTGHTANYFDSNGLPNRKPESVYGPGAAPVAGSGFILGGFKALLGDYSPDVRFDPAAVSNVRLGECDSWGPIASYPDGSLVSMSEDGECYDDDGPATENLTVVRLLGPSGGRPAPYVSISSDVSNEFQRGGLAGTYWLKSLSGVAGPSAALKGVGVAIQRLDKKLLATGKCRWLTHSGTRSVNTRARNGVCRAPHFMPAAGGAKWKFKLRRPLPLGKYRLYVRAKVKDGLSTPFNKDPDTYRTFKVI